MSVRTLPHDLPRRLPRQVFGSGSYSYCAGCGHNIEIHDLANKPWACKYCTTCDALEHEAIGTHVDGWLIKMTGRRRPSIPRPVVDAVLDRDGMTCRYCSRRVHRRKKGPGRLHLDHVMPRSLGGHDTVANLVVSCARCNLKKHADPTIVPTGWGTAA